MLVLYKIVYILIMRNKTNKNHQLRHFLGETRKKKQSDENSSDCQSYLTLGFLPVRKETERSTEFLTCSISGVCSFPALR